MASKTSSTTTILASLLLGSTVTLAVTYVLSRRTKKRRNEHSAQHGATPSLAASSSSTRSIPDALREEQLSRHTLYFGQEGMASLKGAKVVVVGLGGVGSHAAHMLARAGVSHLRLIDFDQVTLSSLNRHACATLQDVGIPKVTSMERFLQQICPDPKHLKVEAIVQMYTADNGEQLLEGEEWDIVIDAIDDVPTKAALLAQCISSNIRVISCMGAGGKSDVTRLHISDLKAASRDPLASKLRQHLKRSSLEEEDYMDKMEQLAVVYSSEKVVMKLAEFTEEQKQSPNDYGAVDNMRIRVLPVLGTMPAVMGMTCAAMALCELGGMPFSPVTGERVGRSVRHKLLQRIKNREKKIAESAMQASKDVTETENGKMVNGQWIGPIQIDIDDVEYLLEVWRNRCAVTGGRLGVVLELIRWDLTKPSTCSNLVLMGSSALQKFEKDGKSSIPKNVQATIEARLQSCRTDAHAY